jgi:D-aminopeptidase
MLRSVSQKLIFAAIFLTTNISSVAAQAEQRPRARDIGLVVGIFPTGPLNAITDVAGVKVGHSTIIQGDDIRTGVTAIIPGPGNLYTHPMPAWIHVGNGYGKLVGETQVREFGEIETPILLTCTLCTGSWVGTSQSVPGIDWRYPPLPFYAALKPHNG